MIASVVTVSTGFEHRLLGICTGGKHPVTGVGEFHFILRHIGFPSQEQKTNNGAVSFLQPLSATVLWGIESR